MALLLLILLLTIFSVVLFISRFLSKPYPPGPRGLPVIGNMLMMDQLSHRGLAKLASQYGGIFHLRMGIRHIVVVSSPDMAREVLQAHDKVPNRPASIALDYLSYDRANMAFADYSPFWRQMRKICVIRLFSRTRVESWDSVRDEMNDLLRVVASNAGQVVDIGDLVFGFTEKIIYRAAFGSRLSDGHSNFLGLMQEFSKLFGAFNICDFFPGLSWADPQGLKARLRKARGSLDGFIDTIIDQHILKKAREKNIKGCDDNDMVDELLAFYTGDGEAKAESDELQGSIKLTRDNIKGIIMDIMFGGTETVAGAIEWAMSELMKNPKELKRTQEELANTVGLHRCVEDRDFEKLTYLKCVLKETLRLHPSLPFIPRATAEDVNVAGYYIPARSRVIINLWAMGRDKNCWNDDPEAFKPSRFLNVGAPDYRINNFEFLPFGTGRRSCPGMQLGLYAFEMGVAHLFHCFNWELPDGVAPSQVDMSDVYGLSAPKAIRLTAVPTPRLLCPIC